MTLLKLCLARNKFLTKEMQLFLSKHSISMINNLSHNKCLDKEVQFIIAKCNSIYAKINLAADEFIDKEIQLILVKDENECVRSMLARNRSIDKEMQLLILKDENVFVRRSLGYNPSLDFNIQLDLANDNYIVQTWLSANPSIAEKTQFILAKTSFKDIDATLLRNKSLTKKVKDFLRFKKAYS